MKKQELAINVLSTGTWKDAVEVFKGKKTFEQVFGKATKSEQRALAKYLEEELQKNKSLIGELNLSKGDVLESLGHVLVDNGTGYKWTSESCNIFESLAGKPGWENLDPKNDGLQTELQFIVVEKMLDELTESLAELDSEITALVEKFLKDEI